jgi:hypothetical protein
VGGIAMRQKRQRRREAGGRRFQAKATPAENEPTRDVIAVAVASLSDFCVEVTIVTGSPRPSIFRTRSAAAIGERRMYGWCDSTRLIDAGARVRTPPS